jgi:hypothetical protein
MTVALVQPPANEPGVMTLDHISVRPQSEHTVANIEAPSEWSGDFTSIFPSLPALGSVPEREFLQQLAREGKILGVPSRRRRSLESERAFLALSRTFSHGQPVAEIIREDRGSLFS